MVLYIKAIGFKNMIIFNLTVYKDFEQHLEWHL